MKKGSAFAVLLMALCMLMAAVGLVGCGKDETEEKPPQSDHERTVTLSETAKELDRYESFTLTATVKDENGETLADTVTWKTSDDAVAAVSGGYVEAKGVGTATITASVGEASATCTVTVEDSGALPVLGLTAESVSVVVGGEFTVTGAVMYKRVEQTDAVITYAVEDTKVATVDENGSIKGVAYGTTKLTVTASWHGVDTSFLTVQIPVTVKEDVSLSITGEDATIYLSETTLEGQKFSNTVTYTGSVYVGGSADDVDASKISWVSSDTEIATVSDGVVTATGKKEGTVEITLRYEANEVYVSTPVKVTVQIPTLDKTDEITLYLDANAAESTVGGQIAAEDVFGAGTGKQVERIAETTDTSKDISDNATWISERDAGNEKERTYALAVYNDEYACVVNVIVTTKIITTYEELTRMQEYGNVQPASYTYNQTTITYYNYSGYFVLGNDIVVSSDAPVYEVDCVSTIGSSSWLVPANGFSGTFDGRGYTIYDLHVNHSGLFGDIASGSVIKNVALVNVTVTSDANNNNGSGVLGYSSCGASIENVFISMTTSAARSGMIGRVMNGGSVKNTVIVFEMTAGYNTGAITCWTPSAVTVSNVYVIYRADTTTANRKLVGEGTAQITGKVTEYNEEDLASASFENLPEGWYVAAGGWPMYESSIGGMYLDKTTLTGMVGAQGTLQGWIYGADTSKDVGLPVVWKSENTEVVEISNTGAYEFVGEGTTTIVVSYGKYTASCEVTVEEESTPVEDKTEAATLDVEANSETSLGAQIVAAGVDAGLFESFTPTSVCLESDSVTDYKDSVGRESGFFAAYDTGDEAGRTVVLVVANGETVIYRVKVLVVTKIITTYEDLAGMQNFTDVTTGTIAGDGATYYSYGGYFVLANNLVATGDEAAFAARNRGSISSGGNSVEEMGFHGTFDGRGYTVSGFKYALGGIFGDVGTGAIIRNVAFVNCIANDIDYSATATREDGIGILAVNAKGSFLVDNVYVSAAVNSPNGGALFGRSTSGGTIKNTIVHVNCTGGWNNGAISGWKVSPSVTENVYVIFEGKIEKIFGNTTDAQEGVTTMKKEEVATNSFTGLDAKYWNIVAGEMPAFNSMADIA